MAATAPAPLREVAIPGAKLVHRGKVRDIF